MENDHPKFLGALPDTRTQEEKSKDFQAIEIVTRATPIVWKPIKVEDIPVFFPHNQSFSGTCVAQTVATIVSRNNFREEGKAIDCSASFIYQLRINRPGYGMVGDDALKLMCNNGTSLECLMPSQNMNDEEVDQVTKTKLDIQIAKVLQSQAYFHTPFDINFIASIIESDRKRGVGVPLMVWFEFDNNNSYWTMVPNDKDVSGERVRHSITAIEYGFWNGEKALVCQESAGVSSTMRPNVKNIRIITESWMKKHMILCAYVTDKFNDWRDNNAPAPVKPKYTFTTALTWSEVFNVNPEVKILQDILKYEGIFDYKKDSTGYYGNYTAACVLQYQNRYGIPHDNLKGRRVGPKTIADLNSRYSN